MKKVLYKLGADYLLGTSMKNSREILFIFVGNERSNSTILEINLEYSNLLNLIDANYSEELTISRIYKSFCFSNDRTLSCYYFFINEMIEVYNIDVINFDYYFAKLILNILKNQIFA